VQNKQLSFSCFVEENVADNSLGLEDLIVNPYFWWQPGSSIPIDISRRAYFRERFLPGYPLVWIENAVTHVLEAYWIPRRWFGELKRFVAGGQPPPMPVDMTRALYGAGILVQKTHFNREIEAWNNMLVEASAHFIRHGYVNLSRLLSRLQLLAIAVYYQQLIDRSANIGDSQCSSRVVVHNESLARFIQHQFQHLMIRIVGQTIRPSYVYFAGYQQGSVLEKHTDREQCEFTVSFLVDYGPANNGRSCWPLCLETRNGTDQIYQQIGDALIFRGREIPHWRPELPSHHHSTSLLLHYVPVEFTGPLL
jgi:hypothetical protein